MIPKLKKACKSALITRNLEVQLAQVAPNTINQKPIDSFLKILEDASMSFPVLMACSFFLLKNGRLNTIFKKPVASFGTKKSVVNMNKQIPTKTE